MSGEGNGREKVVRGVSLYRDQLQWAERKSVNVSELLRKLFDEYITVEDPERRDSNAPEATAAVGT